VKSNGIFIDIYLKEVRQVLEQNQRTIAKLKLPHRPSMLTLPKFHEVIVEVSEILRGKLEIAGHPFID
jgi:hypothetical protein